MSQPNSGVPPTGDGKLNFKGMVIAALLSAAAVLVAAWITKPDGSANHVEKQAPPPPVVANVSQPKSSGPDITPEAKEDPVTRSDPVRAPKLAPVASEPQSLPATQSAHAESLINISKYKDKVITFDHCKKHGAQVDCIFWATANKKSTYALGRADGLLLDDGTLVKSVSVKVGGEVVPRNEDRWRYVGLVEGIRTKVTYTMTDIPDGGVVVGMVIFSKMYGETSVQAFPSH